MILALVACGLLLSGCVFVKIKDGGITKSGEKIVGNGVISEKTFEVEDFSRIKLNVPADVTYSVADTPSMVVKVDENLMEYLTVSVSDGTLRIGSTGASFRNFKKLAITLSSTALERLDCDGAVDFVSEGVIRGESFKMEVNGAADVEIPDLDVKSASFEINGAGDLEVNLVDADKVSLQISGAGDADLTGRAKEVRVQVNGTGDVDLTRLQYETLDKKVNGVGSVKTAKQSRL